MKFSTLALAALSTVLTSTTAAEPPDPLTGWKPAYCLTNTTAPANGPTIPRKIGIVLFRAFDLLDVIGPIEIFNYLSWAYRLELSLISENLDPVTIEPSSPMMNKMNSSFFTTLQPTHTFATAPRDLDLLIVPGGMGVTAPGLNSTLGFVREMAAKVEYFMTVCSGTILAAQAGVLDGRRVTTNKRRLKGLVEEWPSVEFVGHARWVIDGRLWSTSGVQSGMDGALGFVECLYGESAAETVTNNMEYMRNDDPSLDPFAALHNITIP